MESTFGNGKDGGGLPKNLFSRTFVTFASTKWLLLPGKKDKTELEVVEFLSTQACAEL